MDYGHRYADKKISAVDRELKTTYRKAQRELKEKLRDFNERFAEKNREQKEKLKNGEITKEEYQSWLAGKVFVRSRWQEQIRMINAVLLDHNRQALNIVNTSRFDVFAENYNFNSYIAEKKMVGMFNLYNAEAVARLMVDDPKMLPEWNIDQKKDYKWNQQKVNNAIRQGIIQGKGVDEITADLTSGLCAKNAARMRMFARTAITGAENAGRQQQMKDAAEMGIEQEKEWLATHDGVTRDAHRALDGQRVPWNQPFKSSLGDIMFPGDPAASMANVANCRCTMRTIYPKYDHSKPRGEGETIDDVPYEEWKKGKKATKKYKDMVSMLNDEKESRTNASGLLDVFTYDAKKGILYGEPILKGIGAKSKSRPILVNPKTKERFEFVDGSRPIYPPDHTIAGKGARSGRKIRDVDRLVETYNASAEGWQKEKARYKVYDEYGEEREIEAHWYQHSDVGRVEYKIKVKDGKVYVDEWQNK